MTSLEHELSSETETPQDALTVQASLEQQFPPQIELYLGLNEGSPMIPKSKEPHCGWRSFNGLPPDRCAGHRRGKLMLSQLEDPLIDV